MNRRTRETVRYHSSVVVIGAEIPCANSETEAYARTPRTDLSEADLTIKTHISISPTIARYCELIENSGMTVFAGASEYPNVLSPQLWYIL
jgi:hypothetical protein